MSADIILPTEKTWKIYEVPSTDPNLLLNGAESWGLTYFKSKTIYIDQGLKPEHKIEVLRHEITHAVIFETQFVSANKYTEEDVCDLMGTYGEIICRLAEEAMYKLEREDEDLEDGEDD